MKISLRAILLALPFLAAPAVAHASGVAFYCGKCAFVLDSHCKNKDGCCNCAGPWYSYWPYNAHFQTPAHPEFPYWPGPMTTMVPSHPAPPPAPSYMPGAQPMSYHQPVGYHFQPPTYWYGR